MKNVEIKVSDAVLITDKSSIYKGKTGVVKKINAKEFVVFVDGKNAKVSKRGAVLQDEKFEGGGNVSGEKLFDVRYINKDRMKMKKSLRGHTSQFIKATSREEAIKKCKKENKYFAELVSVKEKKNVNPIFLEMFAKGGNIWGSDPEMAWNEWSNEQREGFLKHIENVNAKNAVTLSSKYSELPDDIKIEIEIFVKQDDPRGKTDEENVDTEAEISRLQTEIAKHDTDIARYQENLRNSEANKNELAAKLAVHIGKENEDLMPWQKELTTEEIEFICSAINRYGEVGHPNATVKNWKGFKYNYVKDILLKIIDDSHLSADGIATKESVLNKLNIK